MSHLAGFLNSILGLFGLKISRSRPMELNSLKFKDVFCRLSAMEVPVSTVIDIGASDGRWSEQIKPFFKDVHYHLIEANEIHQPGLSKFVGQTQNASYTMAAAGEFVGHIYFDDTNPWGGSASQEETANTKKKVPCTTVDEEISRRKLPAPFLLKLDTHGFEVPILLGAEKSLPQTNVIVLETYNFQLTDQSLTFWEMCAWLQLRGFRPVDLLEPMHRPKDYVLWQTDIVFLRADRPEFSDDQYD